MRTNYGLVRGFLAEIEIECGNQKCGKKFTYSINKTQPPLRLNELFLIHDGNGCCYSASLELTNGFMKAIKCPHCEKDLVVSLIG